jgi:hypothetical protein
MNHGKHIYFNRTKCVQHISSGNFEGILLKIIQIDDHSGIKLEKEVCI